MDDALKIYSLSTGGGSMHQPVGHLEYTDMLINHLWDKSWVDCPNEMREQLINCLVGKPVDFSFLVGAPHDKR